MEVVHPHAAVTAAVELCAARRGRTVLIAVDGCGGAGKSTLAARIAAAVLGSVVVHIDDFAAPSVPEWDWDRLQRQVLDPLLAGRPARYQRWDWHSDSGAEWHDIAPGRVVIVEGVSATRREVRAPWDLTIWIETPRDVRLDRAVERDGPEMLARWLEDWMPSEDAYVERERPQLRVDLVVSGTVDVLDVS